MIIKTDINKIFKIDESNRLFSDFLFTYINDSKNVCNSNLYKSIINYFQLDKKYINLFEKDHSFSKNITELDVNEYKNNPYNKNIVLDNVKYKNYKFEYESFNNYEGFLCDEINVDDNYLEQIKIGYFTSKYNYLTISKDDVKWMLITPHEINTMKKAVDNAFGNVITFGLGLGYFAYMCSIKENVNSVTIIEKDEEIINLFNKFILPKFEYAHKIKIIKEDAIEYLKNDDFNYDYAFIDLWHDTEDGLKLYVDTYKLSLLHPNTKFDFWIEKSMLIVIRRCIISILYEQINNIEYNEINNYYDYLASKLKQLLNNYVINSYEDLIKLLSDENIKNIITKI